MSLIRVITRISPSEAAPEPLSNLLSLGPHPKGFKTSTVTDPSTGTRYTMETAFFTETEENVLERFPGLVRAPEVDQETADRFTALHVPRRILREEVQSLIAAEPVEKCGLKVRFNLRKIKKMRRDSKLRHLERRLMLLRPLLRYFVDGECLICGFLLSDSSKGVVHHLSTHSSYECGSCEAASSSVKEFYAHSLAHQKEKPYLCGRCGKGFKRKHFLTVHNLKDHSEPPVQSRLNAAFLRQTIPPSFACSLCGVHLSSYEEVSHHRETHSSKKESSYQCLFCGKSFFTACLIRYHSHIRVISKRHVCKYCKRSFASHRQFLLHKKEHLMEPRHACEACGKTFYFRNNLTKHVKMMHPCSPIH